MQDDRLASQDTMNSVWSDRISQWLKRPPAGDAPAPTKDTDATCTAHKPPGPQPSWPRVFPGL